MTRGTTNRAFNYAGVVVLGASLACATPTESSNRGDVARIGGGKGTSQAERYYKRGVACMDEFERRDCAVENLEQVVTLNPRDRTVLGDAIFRLIKLYRRTSDKDGVTRLMRQYWELGTRKKDASLRSYGTQFFPSDLTILAVFDVERLRQSEMMRWLDEDVLDYRFTCDENRRRDIEYTAWLKANEDDPEISALDEAARTTRFEEALAKRDGERSPDAGEDANESDEPKPRPLTDVACDTLAALGLNSLEQLDRVSFASRHDDPLRAAASIEVSDLDAKIATGVERGQLVLVNDMRWALVGDDPENPDAFVVRVDADELVVARAQVADEIEQARRAQRRTRKSPVIELANEVPTDSCFYAVATGEVLRWGKAQGGGMAKLLPDPQGLVVAGAVYEHSGLFVRLHTGDKLRASALVWLAQKVLASEPDGDDEQRGGGPPFMGEMDVAIAPHGSDVIFGVTMSPAQAAPMFAPQW